MHLTDKFNLLPPSICIICETQPDGDVVDTELVTRTGVASYLNGRKYVCERCVGEFAKLFGYEKGIAVDAAKVAKEFAERQLANFRVRAVEVAGALKAFAEHPGAADEGVELVVSDTPAQAQVVQGKPADAPADVAKPTPKVKGGTTKGVQKVADSETPSVPSPAVAEAAVEPVEDTPMEAGKAK